MTKGFSRSPLPSFKHWDKVSSITEELSFEESAADADQDKVPEKPATPAS